MCLFERHGTIVVSLSLPTVISIVTLFIAILPSYYVRRLPWHHWRRHWHSLHGHRHCHPARSFIYTRYFVVRNAGAEELAITFAWVRIMPSKVFACRFRLMTVTAATTTRRKRERERPAERRVVAYDC